MKGKNGRKKLNPTFVAKNKKFYRYGFGNLHTRMNWFKHLVKYALHKDFKTVECYKKHRAVKAKRVKEFQTKFNEAIGGRPYVPLSTGGTTTTGKQTAVYIIHSWLMK